MMTEEEHQRERAAGALGRETDRESGETLPNISDMNERFQFDWNDAQSIDAARSHITQAQDFITQASPLSLSSFTAASQQQWAQFLYKMATFYLHIRYVEIPERLDIALEYLTQAKPFLQGMDYYWVLNQEACAYQQKMQKEPEAFAGELEKCNEEVIETLIAQDNDEARLIVAFAYCTKAQGQMALGNTAEAVSNYRIALDIYEQVGVTSSHQYLRAKNVYADYLKRNEQIDLAHDTYQELDTAWQGQPDCANNLFAGRFYVGYAKFLRDVQQNLPTALRQFETAHSILTATGADEFASEISSDIRLLQEAIARIHVRNRSGSPTVGAAEQSIEHTGGSAALNNS